MDIGRVQEVVDKIVRGYHPGIAEQDIEDAVQDVILYVLEKADGYDPARGKLETWLWWVCQSKLHANKEKAQRMHAHFVRASVPTPQPDAEDEIIRAMDTEDAARMIYEYCESMTERTRDVVRRRAENETLEEIGKVYHVTRDRIRQIEVKAYRNIRSSRVMWHLLREYKEDYL